MFEQKTFQLHSYFICQYFTFYNFLIKSKIGVFTCFYFRTLSPHTPFFPSNNTKSQIIMWRGYKQVKYENQHLWIQPMFQMFYIRLGQLQVRKAPHTSIPQGQGAAALEPPCRVQKMKKTSLINFCVEKQAVRSFQWSEIRISESTLDLLLD